MASNKDNETFGHDKNIYKLHKIIDYHLCVDKDENKENLVIKKEFKDAINIEAYAKYKKIADLIFEKLLEDITLRKLDNLDSEYDIINHLIKVVDKDFYCCNRYKMKFNELVDHVFNNHYEKNKKPDKNYIYDHFKIKKNKVDAQKKDVHVSNNINTYKNEFFVNSKSKKFVCNRQKCSKSFKSINGLKYHNTHGHPDENEDLQTFSCPFDDCHKIYKNNNGLKYHLSKNHLT